MSHSLDDFEETSGSLVISDFSFLSHSGLFPQKNAAITWDMVAAWGSFYVRKLAGLKINGPSNGLLLEAGIDPMFSNFKLWFEKTVRHLSPVCL